MFETKAGPARHKCADESCAFRDRRRDKNPDLALIALMANSTRHLCNDRLWINEHSPWADKGSKRLLWNERSVWEACDYVNNRQGDDLPDFD